MKCLNCGGPGPDGCTDECLARQKEIRVQQIATKYLPKPYWSSQSGSLTQRLRGLYAVGPGAMQLGPLDTPEFGWRQHGDPTPIMLEAAQRISDLEEELQKLRIEKFTRACEARGI